MDGLNLAMGVGPREVFEMEQIIADFGLRNRPILSFLGAKRRFYLRFMARAKRHFIPGYIWHIKHRCHKREFLLKFSKDRRRYMQWI